MRRKVRRRKMRRKRKIRRTKKKDADSGINKDQNRTKNKRTT